MPRWGFAMLQIRERALLATDIGCGENSSSRTRSPPSNARVSPRPAGAALSCCRASRRTADIWRRPVATPTPCRKTQGDGAATAGRVNEGTRIVAGEALALPVGSVYAGSIRWRSALLICRIRVRSRREPWGGPDPRADGPAVPDLADRQTLRLVLLRGAVGITDQSSGILGVELPFVLSGFGKQLLRIGAPGRVGAATGMIGR
jgi:hypothetical protein